MVLVVVLAAGSRSPVWASPATFVPTQLRIPAIGVNAQVVPVGTVMAEAPFLGGQTVSTFGVPPDGSRVGWWSDGPPVGGAGMAVLLGHTQVGGDAVFNRLGELRLGDAVLVEDAAQGIRGDFRITRVVGGIPKTQPDALQRVLRDNALNAQVALITCGGDFDTASHASVENIVAFASTV